LGIGRATLYWPSKQALKDKQVAVTIEKWHGVDDTLGHRKLASLLEMSPNRVRRVMHKYGIAARLKRKKDASPGKASQIAPNLVRELDPESLMEVVFSGIFEIRLADGTKVRGCFTRLQADQAPPGLGFRVSYAHRAGHGCPAHPPF
jgi:putative transposase